MEINLTPENASQVISEAKVALVDFYAPWCGPCRALAPVIDQIAAEFDGKVVVAKCNVDDCEDFSSEMHIRNIPCIIYFKDGQAVDRFVGVAAKKDIEDKLNSLLG